MKNVIYKGYLENMTRLGAEFVHSTKIEADDENVLISVEESEELKEIENHDYDSDKKGTIKISKRKEEREEDEKELAKKGRRRFGDRK